MTVFTKIGGLIIVVLVIALVANTSPPKKVNFGVTFTPKYAKYLKLDWQKTYTQILDDLQVRNLRLPSYWDVVEPQKQQFNFAETDYMLSEATKRGAQVILVVGIRQPRWPECHIPTWAKNLPVEERQKVALEMVRAVVERYRNEQSVWAWQVENEPSLKAFGEGCEILDRNFLKSELKLVRSLSSKPIIMTDSGELGFWVTSMQLSDIFGTTVYRKVYDKWLGYMTYPLPPAFYGLKSNLVRGVFAGANQKTIIAELQAEPWFADGRLLPPDQQAQLFTTENLKNYVKFAGATGFDEAYLWGVEWWYFMAANGYPEYLDYAGTLFK